LIIKEHYTIKLRKNATRGLTFLPALAILKPKGGAGMDVLFQDPDIAVIIKPVGMDS
jgi:23S rRNA-/tRNA-specific pseudouridylate synthase